ncbi:fatty-acid amide hydrolase 2-like [Dreissena polymorpha]|uniref:Amidase domain-containing protein n=1 Tax=Dreissena polymorpha TaxID=45954 RepID=A0A9D4HQJ6_DREPO|nr:fatty-acid amide hydrolase 2-like [Dreissena polymorpha]KAH3727330.1 hypothetical protein DPMN_053262 [Dreissena polymorpha]
MAVAKHVQTVFSWLLTLLGWVFVPLTNYLFSRWYDKTVRTVQPVEDEVLLKSATEIARKIRSRELRAEDVMSASIARVQRVQGLVNAVVAPRYEDAIVEARELDKKLDADSSAEEFSETNMPFLGVPLSVKEAFAVKGMPNCSGLVSRKDYRSTQDCPVVERLRRAGAIPFCMTNISELCMWYESANRVYGRTSNPYNTSRIVGGSSGGEAANIASGAAVLGVGSDIGGSIRMPAFFCGIFGHRSSRGLVPNEGQFPMATGSEVDLLSTGPMCRYAEDLLPMLKVMSANNKQAQLDEKVDVTKLTIYNIEDDGGGLLVSRVDPQLKQAQARAVHYLQTSLGATVKNTSISKFKYAIDMWGAKMTKSGGKSFCDYMRGDQGEVNPLKELLLWLVGRSKHTLPAIALGLFEKGDHLLENVNKRALKSFDKMEEEITTLLDENSVLIYPTHPKIAPYHNQPLLYPFNWAYTGLFNTMGLPVTAIPLGLSREGLPMGMQIVAGMNYDRVSIAVAEELARAKVAEWVNPGAGLD